MKSNLFIVFCLVIGIVVASGAYVYLGPILISRGNIVFDDNVLLGIAAAGSSKKHHPKQPPTLPPATVGSSFIESFGTAYMVKEAGDKNGSANPNWWLSSGGYMYSANGIGSTIAGVLSSIDPWRVAYFLSNPLDTDNGYYPQNIFRLVLRSQWQNFTQEAYFRITKDNLSDSPNRNASNGLLLFNRYQDAFNLYYTGIRVDGHVTIKKKTGGTYYTLAYKPFISGPAYNRDSSPNLLPQNTWIGLRSVVRTNSDNTVGIKLYVDNGRTGNWVLAAEANDDGKSYGGGAIVNAGYAGIRTDFMDVEFDDYKIAEQ